MIAAFVRPRARTFVLALLLALASSGAALAQTCADCAACADGTPCSDANSCTSGDACSAGVCVGTPIVDCNIPRLVVANGGSATANVIRTSDMVIEATPVTGTQPHSVAIRPDAAVAYVTNNASDNVTVIDLASNAVLTTIAVGLGPRGVAFSPDGTRAYVANSVADTISVIDAASHAVTGTINLDPTATLPPFTPFGVTVSTTGAFLYVTNNAANSVSVFRTLDNLLVTTIPVGVRPQGIMASPTGVFVYVANGGSNSVNVIRVPDHANVAFIPVGTDPHSIAFTPDGRFALVTNALGDSVSKINTDTFLVVSTFPVPQVPQGIDIRGTGDRAYLVSARIPPRVVALNVSNGLVVGSVNVGTAPVGIAVAPIAVFQLAAAAAPSVIAPGGSVTYTFTYSNTGRRLATGVTLTASIPASSTFVSATGGGVVSGTNVVWNLGTLAGGASGQVSFVVGTTAPLPPGLQLTSTGVLAESGPATAQAAATATVSSAPQYSLGKVEDSDPVIAGAPLTYTITYANNASADANGDGVVITETYDPNFVFGSSTPAPAAGTNNRWDIGLLPVGGSGTITVTGTVASPLANGTILANQVRLTDAFNNVVTAQQSTAVTSNPTLGIALADDRDPVPAGGQLVYTINYTNTGNGPAAGVVATVAYDPNVTFVSATPPPDPGMTDRWTIGALDSGSTGQIAVTVQVGAILPNGTLLASSADITDGGAGFATASQNTVVSSSPALGVTMLDNPDPVRPAETLTYTISYGNTGSDVATAASISLTYDPTVSFVSATPPPTTGDNQWLLGDLPPGASGTIVVDVLVNAALGSIVSSNAVISAGGALSASAGANTSVLATAILSLGLGDAPDPVVAGQPITYTVQYANGGNEPATGAGVSLVYDPNVTFVTATPPPDVGTTNQWTLGTIAAGATGQIQVTTLVGAPLANGTLLTSQGTFVADGGLLASASESTTVQSEPGLAIAKIDAVDPTPPSANLTYTITYSNPGTDATTGVVVTEVYDPLVTFVSSVPPPDAGGNNQWTIGTLAGGSSGTIDVTVAVPLVVAGTLLTNRATVVDAGGRSASASEDTTVRSPLFSLDVSDNPDPAEVLSPTTFTFAYGNASGAPQSGVVVRATFGIGFTPTSATPPADAGTNDTWTLGTLAAGQTGQITVQGIFGTTGLGGLARTDAQIENANGVAFASETTALVRTVAIEQYSSVILQNASRDVWRFRGWLQVPTGFDPTGIPFTLSLTGPDGTQHVTPLAIPAFEELASGRLAFKGNLPGNGEVRVKLRPRALNWVLAVRAVGVNIVPPFLPSLTFQGIATFGQTTYVTPQSSFRELRPGAARRYP